MKTKKGVGFLSVALIFSLLFTSCIDKDYSIGNGLLPDDYYMQIKKAEFDIPVEMKMPDKVVTASSGYAIVGSINDPDFGMMQSSTAFHVYPSDTTLSYGNNPVPKSLQLFIYGINDPSYISAIVGNYSINDAYLHQNIYVHRLNTEIDSINTIYNNSLGTADYNAIPMNMGGGNVFFGNNPNMYMNLSLDYARELLSATKEERQDIFKFMKRYKGLYLRTDPVLSTYNGGRLCYVSLSGAYMIGMSLTYTHTDNSIPAGKDSTILYLASSARAINIISHQSSPHESSNPTGDLLMEGFAGIKPYINFDNVKSSIDTWAQNNQIDLNKVVVTKAELQLHYKAPQDYTFMQNFHPPLIFLNTKEKDSHDLYRYMPTDDIFEYGTSSGSSSNRNPSKEIYSLNISSYIQKLIHGKLTNDEKSTWLMSNSPIIDPNTGSLAGYSVDNVAINKVVFFGNNDPSKKPKLILTYALMN